MATTAVTLNIDNTLLPTAANALAWKGGYQSMVTDTVQGSGTFGQQITNPITKNAFAKIQLTVYVMNCIADYQAQQAQAAIVAPASSLIS